MPPAVPPPASTGWRAALLFALVAERLNTYYEHGQWLTDAQGKTRARDWLARSGRRLAESGLAAIAAASDDMARRIGGQLSRQAGLYTAHEMNEALDPNYQSELGRTLLDECTRRIETLDEAAAGDPP